MHLKLIIAAFVCALSTFSFSPSIGQEPAREIEVPELRFIGSSHPLKDSRPKPVLGQYWTPDGENVTDRHDLALIDSVQGYPDGQRDLYFFFTHPEFCRSFARLSIEDQDGRPIDPMMDHRTSELAGKAAEEGMPAVIALRVFLPNDVNLPDEEVTVKLRYTLEDWTRIDTIRSFDDHQQIRHYESATLLALGQSGRQEAFLSLLVHDGLDSEFMFSVRGSLDGKTLIEPPSREILSFPAYVENSEFHQPLDKFQAFEIYKQKVREAEYKGVAIRPRQVTTEPVPIR